MMMIMIIMIMNLKRIVPEAGLIRDTWLFEILMMMMTMRIRMMMMREV